MKVDSAKAVDMKAGLTSSLLSFRDELCALVLKASAAGVPPREQAKAMKALAIRHVAKSIPQSEEGAEAARKAWKGKRYSFDGPLVAHFAALSVAIARQAKAEGIEAKTPENRAKRSSMAFRAIESGLSDSRTIGVTEPARKYEAELKEIMADSALRVNRREPTPVVFYLCSKHMDCAQDHLPWQGRLYIDDQWRTWVKDREERKAVNVYLSSHKIPSLQKTMHRPVWLMTRPNCRHYMDGIQTSEVLSGKAPEDMLRERGMIHDVGPRGRMKTIFHRTDAGWYTPQNVEAIIRQYEERLSALIAMSEAEPRNRDIDRAIVKTKELIRKWKGFRSRGT